VTPAQVRNEIERVTSVLFSIGAALDSNPVLCLTSHGQTIVTWSNDMVMSALFDQTSTLNEYLLTLRNRWYTTILSDGALLQLSYTFQGNTLVKHRLSFHPCPIIFEPEELQELTLQELLEVLEGTEFRDRLRLEGAVRFDYDLAAGTKQHPPVHLTVSRSSSRIPVFAPLSVGHFIRFVFLHFYPKLWQKSEELRVWSCASLDACLPELDDDHLYVQWKRK